MLIARRDQVENDLAKLALSAPCAHTVARLRCLRGIDTLSALGLCAEIGEWERFDHPDQLSAYLGIVPQSTPPARSGGWCRSRRQAPPTPGGCWSRRPITTAAARWSARRSSVANAGSHPRSSTSPGARSVRLNARWRQLGDARRKPGGIVAVAIARELAAYCWENRYLPDTAPTSAPTPTTRKRLTNPR